MVNGVGLQNDITWLMAEPGKITMTILVVIAIGLIALTLELLRVRLNGWLAMSVVFLILLAMAYLIHPARAHDHSRPELTPWFESLRAKGINGNASERGLLRRNGRNPPR